MAFVVISHQDPNQTSLLPEILQKYTEMPVVQVGRWRGCPAKHSLHQTFRLRPRRPPGYLDPSQARKVGVNTTIDIFFRHLAEDQDGKAVGHVLSGMGATELWASVP